MVRYFFLFSYYFHTNSTNGFGNALSFKNVTDEDIEYCEAEIRKIGTSIECQLNDSADINCEKNEDFLNKTFGKTFAENPSQFHFLRGELVLIKEIVSHVKKIVNANGSNTGLDRFKYKEKRTRNTQRKRVVQIDTQPNTKGNVIPNKKRNIVTKKSPNELKAALFERIKSCLIEYQADVDVECLCENIVDVEIDNNEIVGEAACVVCKKKVSQKESNMMN